MAETGDETPDDGKSRDGRRWGRWIKRPSQDGRVHKELVLNSASKPDADCEDQNDKITREK